MKYSFHEKCLTNKNLVKVEIFNRIVIKKTFLFIAGEYSTYAKIDITKNGYRHLELNGFTFGETKVTDRYIHWRCTANIRDHLNKSKRCATQVKTKIRNGYEMIRSIDIKHSHPARFRPVRKQRR